MRAASDCGSGKACGTDVFCVGSGFSDGNHQIAHEMGHLIQRRSINAALGGGCTWNWNSSETEKCATNEGWADFTAGATYYERWATTPLVYSAWRKRYLEGETPDVDGGTSLNQCLSISSSPDSRPGTWHDSSGIFSITPRTMMPTADMAPMGPRGIMVMK